ncbi:MAG: hypothetical protein WAL91_00670, partial [Propionicimonas sp.]
AGELIGFFDDDDRYPPDWITRHVQNLVANPDAVLSYGGLRLIDADGTEVGIDPARPAPDPRRLRRREVQLLAGSYLIRRLEFLSVGGFNPLFTLAEDLDLILRCVGLGPFLPVPDLVRDYRTHPANATGDHRALAASVARIVGLHLRAARANGDAEAVADFRVSLAANRRYASWRAGQALGAAWVGRRPGVFADELVWVLRFAPETPAVLLAKAVRRAVVRLPFSAAIGGQHGGEEDADN